MPIGDETVTTRVIRSDTALAAFFMIHTDLELPPHSHKGQWGTVIEGSISLNMHGQTRTFQPGESYDIPAGVEHAAFLPAGTIVFDVFEEPDRYPLRN
ncbi:MAG: cupin domain-containing protein [Pseudomonadota bacterium]